MKNCKSVYRYNQQGLEVVFLIMGIPPKRTTLNSQALNPEHATLELQRLLWRDDATTPHMVCGFRVLGFESRI